MTFSLQYSVNILKTIIDRSLIMAFTESYELWEYKIFSLSTGPYPKPGAQVRLEEPTVILSEA